MTLSLVLPGTASAQFPPVAPIALAGGRLVVSAQAAASVSSDDPAYFNYSSYDDNLMRLVAFDAAATFRVSDRISLAGDLRLDGFTSGGSWSVHPYAAFIRIHPWADHAFDVQAGLIPPVFGAFSRRAYATDNPLIGFPLMYQYLLSLRSDAVPESADELLRLRGRGWLVRYPSSDGSATSGLPIIDGLQYQSGVEVHVGDGRPIEAAAAFTSGSLAVPTGEYAHPMRQFSGRFAVRPVIGLVLGLSASRGRYLDDEVSDEYAPQESGIQTAVGFDVEYSREHWVVRGEGIVSRWTVPQISPPFIDSPLGAFGTTVEARYRVLPRVYVAARGDTLDFSDVTGSAGTMPWEAPVRRVEIGGGFSLQRNLLVKLSWQRNWRLASPTIGQNMLGVQVIAWF